MKFRLLFLGLGLIAMTMRISGAAAEAALPGASTTTDLRPVLSTMIGESDHNFENRFGPKIKDDESGSYFDAKPFAGMVPSQEIMALIKGYDFYIADIPKASSIRAAHDSFFSMPQFNDGRGTYTLEPDKGGSTDKKEVTVLSLNGRRVANYTHYLWQTEDVLMVGPLGGRPGGPPAAAADASDKTKAFTEGTRILIERAAGNFAGMTKDLIRKTDDGDLLYNAAFVPEMQTDPDGQVIMQMGNKNVYMNSYDDVKGVEFAFASFLALPKNGPSGAYTVEVDSRLEKASSTTYHLRYNGQIVADFIKFKTKPKVFLSFGYRDGIPKNLASAGKTYSQATIEETKRMINEHTVCPGCRGSGTEEVKTDYVYVGSGLPKMKTVPCHFCNGTGHL